MPSVVDLPLACYRDGGLVGVLEHFVLMKILLNYFTGEEDYRKQGACVSTSEWHQVLLRSGFSGVDLEFVDDLDKRSREYSFLISTALKFPSEPLAVRSTSTRFTQSLIIAADESLVQKKMAEKLKIRLLSSNSTTDCQIVTLEAIPSIYGLKEKFCFCLVEAEAPFLFGIGDTAWTGLQRLLTTVPGIIWATNGGGDLKDPRFRLVDGLARVARTEYNKLIFVTLALENVPCRSVEAIENILKVFYNTLSNRVLEDFESEYIERENMLEIGRLVEADYLNKEVEVKTKPTQTRMQKFGECPPLALHIDSPGLLDSLEFREDETFLEPLDPGELEVQVKAIGVNFRDCLTALGQIDTKMIGCECSGVVSRVGQACDFQPGERVSTAFMNTYKTYARGPSELVVKIPDEMSFAEASAFPVVFVTAWYALYDLARLQRGESILIHAGAGGTGQAAIQVAKYLGAEVYVTVGSDEKKSLLMNLYEIHEDYIFYSRDLSFAQGIMRVTGGQGVDVVLNSLSGDSLVASWECVATVSVPGPTDSGIFLTELIVWPLHRNWQAGY
jgi:hypothetical protein